MPDWTDSDVSFNQLRDDRCNRVKQFVGWFGDGASWKKKLASWPQLKPAKHSHYPRSKMLQLTFRDVKPIVLLLRELTSIS